MEINKIYANDSDGFQQILSNQSGEISLDQLHNLMRPAERRLIRGNFDEGLLSKFY